MSWHAKVRQETNLFSRFLGSIRKTLTENDLSQFLNLDLQRILEWFILDYFQHL